MRKSRHYIFSQTNMRNHILNKLLYNNLKCFN